MSKRALLIGGTPSDLLLIERAKNEGYLISAVNNMPDIAVNRQLEAHFNLDYSQPQAILALAQKECFDRVIAGSNDTAYQTAAFVAERLGLPGYDSVTTARVIHEKDLYRDFCRQIGVSSPSYCAVDRQSDLEALIADWSIPLPVIVKPVDRSGGKGITTVFDSMQLKSAIERALASSLSQRCVVEEYIEGSMHSFSSFIVNQKVVFDYYDSEYHWLNPYQIAYSSGPYHPSADHKSYLRGVVERIASELKLTDGLIHGQYLQQGDQLYIIEFTRRTPGDWYAIPVEYLTQFSYTLNTLNGYLGQPLTLASQSIKTGHYVIRYAPMASRNGILVDLTLNERLQPHLLTGYAYLQSGDRIDDYRRQRLGVYLFKFNSYSSMMAILADINRLFVCELEEEIQ
ncbi:ATP-grasp domain-containing protein [Ectothiorhodospiraceae bacterium BW-2]|nr:ATP-grasp domain-containing protein [Ectothiorhodospiraceae bacterium BW-2]